MYERMQKFNKMVCLTIFFFFFFKKKMEYSNKKEPKPFITLTSTEG
jgi:hypothetical protein